MLLKHRLKQLRTEKKLTQKELGDHLELTPATISFYEIGRRTPDYETLINISNYFDVSLDYLLGKTHIRNSQTAKYLKDLPSKIVNELSSEPENLNKLMQTIYVAKKNNIQIKGLVKVIESVINAIP
ncbi:helix-turn-helix domain-containing protein [Selenihalanaerobacter shriftii]|uniref:DNA-binding transcriptional regulator, XRE-family HTH domain n=1 Tax=Selenihalanaerobacter shriftii TaxID=142842 RepID=A0A1T4NUV3_9FIRM|nr:helix-turn-helix transcriptional regulator [Selenihalanaerobacter shriftii]SJZ82945.1 DNA-binding transcriptional regulator, XRE-family HTH domain [Selenihalanaerobacter shriftii]